MSGNDTGYEHADRGASDPPGPRPNKSPPNRFHVISDRIRPRLKTIGAAITAIAAIGAVVGGFAGYWSAWRAVKSEIFHDQRDQQKSAATQPGTVPRLSLVVLPFANLNNDPEQDYFADGITTDLTTDLGRIPGAFVIGRGTAFTYKQKKIDPKLLGSELGVRWAVEGAVRRAADQIRINVSLIDLATGGEFWSDRFDGDRPRLAELQDEIVARLSRSLSVKLIEAESRRSERQKNPDAVDLAMRGWAKHHETPRTRDSTLQALELFDSALRLDPDNADAMVGKSWNLVIKTINQWSQSPGEDVRHATELIDKALAKSPSSAAAHTVKGQILNIGRPEAALFELDAALEIDPNFTPAYITKGTAFTLSGRAREALLPLQIGLRLSPKDPAAYLMHFQLCHAHVHLKEYAEAIDQCRRATNLNPVFWLPYIDLIVAYDSLGRPEEARQALADLYRVWPGFTVQRYQKLVYSFSTNPQFRREFDDILLAGLRRAGAKEQ
ncbi:adenylate cyclase [Nitrobacteraceae bacterium AZCC 1564]